MEDFDGDVWIGTLQGLSRYKHKTGLFQNYYASDSNKNSISDSYVNLSGLFQSKDSIIWIATRKGLNTFNKKTEEFTNVMSTDGEITQYIYTIFDDTRGNLWCVGDNVYYKLQRDEVITIKSYYKSSGVKMSVEAAYKSKYGRFYYGGKTSGYYTFHPDSLYENLSVPPVHITNFMLFNKPVNLSSTEAPTPLKVRVEFLDTLVLNYDQSVFTFEFSSLNYTLSEKNQFAYKMEGFDKDWTYTNAERRYATYTNLDPGEYIFRVKASNNDRIWNERVRQFL